ncbi:DNA repair protein RadC [Neisseria sp. ZJ106]|uniref:DNA repair protein RadC n=1 Tax=Neisseria lisongii TaxID=2912188 RepID=A0ABY7RK51_9NEIS|nr:DNA repair protein RadC [Neisseria lisongii]MCF7522051.1 DNA repair protein RadC [Neisseria lisongii]WCL71848.1 DNA repair protein RadC [Neisseria lisongii]
MSIKHWPEGERPREKLLARGAAALSDAELLAILLRVGTRGMSAVDLARYLLGEFGSLGRLMSADARTLSAFKGMGLASFTQFAVVREIGRRILSEELQQNTVLGDPQAAADYLRLHLGHEKVEVSVALLLNSQQQLIAMHELSRGTVAENTVYVREIVKLALDEYAAGLILAHNHPGGSAMPSESDIALTRRLQQALALVDVSLLDHFVITAQSACSMKMGGWLG